MLPLALILLARGANSFVTLCHFLCRSPCALGDALEKWAMFMSHCAGPMFPGNSPQRNWTWEQWQSLPLIDEDGCAVYRGGPERVVGGGSSVLPAEDPLALSDHSDDD